MAQFYGLVVGNRGEATRMGSKSSGFRSSCQSYDGSVVTRMCDKDGTTMVSILVADGSTSYGGETLFYGTIEDLKKKVAK